MTTFKIEQLICFISQIPWASHLNSEVKNTCTFLILYHYQMIMVSTPREEKSKSCLLSLFVKTKTKT